MEHLLTVSMEDPDSHRRVFNPILQVYNESIKSRIFALLFWQIVHIYVFGQYTFQW